jgi:hypothetical protein
MALWIKTPDGTIERAAGGAFLPLTGGTLTGNLTLNGPGTLPDHAVTLSQITSEIGGGGFLPLSGGTISGDLDVSGDLTVTGNSDLKVNVPDDYWASAPGTVFTDLGMVGGSMGSYGVAMTANGYRNFANKWVSFNAGGLKGAVVVDLQPNGTFQVRTATDWDSYSGSHPPARLLVDDAKTNVIGDLVVNGQTLASKGSAAAPGLGFSSFAGTGFVPGTNNVATYVKGSWQFVVYDDKTRVIKNLQVDGQTRASAGSNAAPSYAFSGATNSGMHHNGTDVYFCSDSTEVLRLGKAFGLRMNNKQIYNVSYVQATKFQGSNGTKSAPSYTFKDDTQTGMSRGLAGSQYDELEAGTLSLTVKGERAAFFGASSATTKGVWIPGIAYNEVSAAGNVVIDASDGRIFRSVSARRNMQEIEAVEQRVSNRVYDLQPIWFRSTCSNDDITLSNYGFAAEDCAEVDPRLATYSIDEDGNNVPDNVNTNAILALLVTAVKTQRDTITDLTERLEALENPEKDRS